MLDNLLEKQGMSQARQLLYGGCSAGGLTAYIHADYVASRMPRTTTTVAIADAMFSLNSKSYTGQDLFPQRMKWGFTAWNAASSVNQDCLKSYGEADGYQCLFGGNAAKFVRTPIFVVNSKYDTWQEKAIIGAPSSIATCPDAAKKFWVEYGHNMTERLRALPAVHGAFVTNCPAHCQTGSAPWLKTTINGTAMGDAFVAWWKHYALGDPDVARVGLHRSQPANRFRWVEQCDVSVCASDQCA